MDNANKILALLDELDYMTKEAGHEYMASSIARYRAHAHLSPEKWGEQGEQYGQMVYDLEKYGILDGE